MKLKRVEVGSQSSSMNVVDMVGSMLLYVLVYHGGGVLYILVIVGCSSW